MQQRVPRYRVETERGRERKREKGERKKENSVRDCDLFCRAVASPSAWLRLLTGKTSIATVATLSNGRIDGKPRCFRAHCREFTSLCRNARASCSLFPIIQIPRKGECIFFQRGNFRRTFSLRYFLSFILFFFSFGVLFVSLILLPSRSSRRCDPRDFLSLADRLEISYCRRFIFREEITLSRRDHASGCIYSSAVIPVRIMTRDVTPETVLTLNF